MAVSKSGVRIDDWREYFRNSNANIFEIIEGAIMLAASDCPKEFKVRRDGIAQILFSCKLIKCSGCDREELALPLDNQEHDDHGHDHDHGHHALDEDDDEGIKYKSNSNDVNANCSKGSSKVINGSRNGNVDCVDDDHQDLEPNENDHHVSNYSYGDAEALSDEIEEESRTFDEVLRIKEIVDNSSYESASNLCHSLRKLQLMAISVETLKATEIGKSVNVLRKHASKDIRQIAKSLIGVWKDMVDEWVDATNKITVSENTPESMNPSIVDEEEGLPSPPLDDLAFLNPHSMSLELNEFFDGMDDYGNPRKSRERNKNDNNGGKPPFEKHNLSKREQQKPLNGSTMVPKPTMVKPSKPRVSGSSPERRVKPNMYRKLQNPEKLTHPKRPVAPLQRKPTSPDQETEQDKLEATKRKLQERYKQAENAKRQRTIQVMELHDLPKQSAPIKNQHTRPGSNHNRHWGQGRF
uniref:probable mediator of RNA polymerase II transcription subunit 26b n=1 Tax=Erigeron canadensis TaxID=72917 RepID=UPI001CB8D28C|nr:probable mediator of RNA polymerase II transcription subunit 26b [Erigeron canadensis]